MCYVAPSADIDLSISEVQEKFCAGLLLFTQPDSFSSYAGFQCVAPSTLHSTHQYLASWKGKVERIQIIFLMLFHCPWDWVKDLLWFEHCRLKTKAGTTVSLQLTDTQCSHSHAHQILPLHHASRHSGWFSFLSYLALTGFPGSRC